MYIAGVDEVGRGAWAGPIVAAAVILGEPIPGLADSKLLTKLKRQELSDIIQKQAACFAIAELSAQQIDDLGLGEANRLVMRQAINALETHPTLVRVDGFSCGTDLDEEVYIKGDQLFAEISAASIIAKVYRDNLMHQLHELDSRYGFDSHVGYGTKQHSDALREHGPSGWHRQSFKPVAQNMIRSR